MSRRQENQPSRRSLAFSLVEILVCVAIIALLVGILASVFHRGKKSAHDGVMLSNGHQIGLALNMYAEDNSQIIPLSVLPVLRSGYVTRDIVYYRNDPFEKGAACNARTIGFNNPAFEVIGSCDSDPISWFGLDDFGTYPNHYDKLRAHPDGGPVALVIERGKQTVKKPYFHAQVSPCGSDVWILRVRFDSSVIRRSRPRGTFTEGGFTYNTCELVTTFMEK